MTTDKLHSKEFVQMVFCTKDALFKVNTALSSLLEFKNSFNEAQHPDQIKKQIQAYLNAVEEISINANELKILSHKL